MEGQRLCRMRVPSSTSARRTLYWPPACSCLTMELQMISRTCAGMGSSRYSSDRQSSNKAWSCCPAQAMNWSMMPLRAPTKAFSARWQARAIVASGSADAIQRQQGQRCGYFNRGRRTEPCAQRNITLEREIKSADAHAFLRQTPGNPHRVVAPVLAGGGGQRVRRIGNLFAHVFRVEQNAPIVAGANGGDGAEIDGRRHDKPAAIVGVLADQVHAARRRASHGGFPCCGIVCCYIV